MVGLGESYLAAFALAVGLGETIAGLVATAPILLGALIQLVSPIMIRRLGSRRRWVVACSVVQGLSLVPLAIAAWIGSLEAWALMLVATVYWAAGLSTGPAWNTWIGQIVPTRVRTSFLANRARVCQLAVLAALIAAGFALQYGAMTERRLEVFGWLFTGAAIARLTSAYMLWRQSEPAESLSNYRLVPVREMVRRLRSQHDTGLLTYMLFVTVAVQISGPFFTPYMLSELQLNYVQYLSLTAVSFSSKALAMPFIGRLGRRYGSGALLWAGGLGIVPLSGFWIVFDEMHELLMLQVFAGVIWAVYELATLLLLFDHIHEDERTSVLTFFNTANAAAMVGGSLLGGFVLRSMNETVGAYHMLFGISVLGRLLTLGLLAGLVAPGDRPFRIDVKQIAVRVLAIRPSLGSIDRPVLPSLHHDTEDRRSDSS